MVPSILTKSRYNGIFKQKGNEPIDPTEVSTSLITPFAKSRAPLSIAIETKRANSFLEALILIPFQPAYIHNIHLHLSINQDENQYAIGKEEEQCRGNVHHERVGCVKGLENVRYIMYPKGKVMVYVKGSENPFRLQTENDVSVFFLIFRTSTRSTCPLVKRFT